MPNDESKTKEFATETGGYIRSLFNEAEQQRRETEQRFLKDLRQYKGEYDPEVQRNFDEGQSRVFNRLTRKKVRTINARLRDTLFPSSKEKNWDLEPTEIPQLNPEEEGKLLQRLGESLGRDPRESELDEAKSEFANQRAENMKTVMQDQLEELKYEEIVGRDVLHSGCIYGTGILKGPLVNSNVETRWKRGEQGWQLTKERDFSPHIEFAPIWDIYPDMAARDFDDVQYVFQRHMMPKFELVELAMREDFNTEAIKAYLEDQPAGDSDTKHFEQELRSLGERDINPKSGENGRYELLEFWGALPMERAMEVLSPEDVPSVDNPLAEVWANVWLLGSTVIKAVMTPVDGVKHPYNAFHFDKDETNIFGEGVPALMRDDQEILNAATRAMLDNAALAAGFMGEVNVDLLEPDEDPRNVHNRKIWLRRGSGDEARMPAVNQIPLQPHTDAYLAIVQNAERWGHEHTVPAYMGGANEGGGPADTASGLQQLMNSASIEINDLVRNFDNGLTKPFIRSLYNWNMVFSDDEEVKGDFKVVPKGSSALVEKEIKNQELIQFGSSIMADPSLRSWVKDGQYVQEVAETMNVDPSMIRTPEEHQRAQEQQGPSPDMIEAQVKQQEAQIKALQAEVDAQEKMARAEKARADALLTQVQAATAAGGSAEVEAIDTAINGEEDSGTESGGSGASSAQGKSASAGTQGPTPARGRGGQKSTPQGR